MTKPGLTCLHAAFHKTQVAAAVLKYSTVRLRAWLCLFAITPFMLFAAQAQEATSGVVQSTAIVQASTPEQIEIGKRIYTQGILSSGAMLAGQRFGKNSIAGEEAACVHCHRPSGMGQVEGDILIPPINGNYLYATRKDKQVAIMDPRVSKQFNQYHDPYTDATFATAVNEGINNQGREMHVAMPRYHLEEADRKALLAYLTQLSAQWSPGVSENLIRFATVITPDVDPAQRKAFIDMQQAIVQQKNGSTHLAHDHRTRHHMASAAELILGTERMWQLDIWELQGDPQTWTRQLNDLYQKQPVFALLSGLSHSNWQPVHDFCDHEKVPCWFPSVDLPPKAQSQYAFYFSSGVLLEANVIAHHLLEAKHLPKHVYQIYHDNTVGQAATQELGLALKGSTIKLENRLLSGNANATSLKHALAGIQSGDVVMFWLTEEDINALANLKPRTGVSYYFSGKLASPEKTMLTQLWKNNAHFAYLYDLPQNRKLNLDYYHAWMNAHHFATVDEPMQTEVFFAANFMTDTISEMLNNIYRDYLLERSETMINKREGVKSEQETRDRYALGKTGDVERRFGTKMIEQSQRVQIVSQIDSNSVSHGTTLYPHLSLGPEQRFASKGGYIVKFASKKDNTLTDESGWIVP